MTTEEKIIELEKNKERLLDAIGSLVENRDMDGQGHIRRTRVFTEILATEVMISCPEYGLDEEQVKIIASASALHDIGKISVPDSILFKPGRLTKEEYDLMKTHTVLGCEMLEKMKGSWDEKFHQACVDICMFHHEKYDGKGYPKGLSGDDIPLAAQIVSIVDIYDALVCVRIYKDAYKPAEAYHMIVSGECGEFNPKLLECFRDCSDKFEIIAARSREAGN